MKLVFYIILITLKVGCAQKVIINGNETEREDLIPTEDIGVKIDKQIDQP